MLLGKQISKRCISNSKFVGQSNVIDLNVYCMHIQFFSSLISLKKCAGGPSKFEVYHVYKNQVPRVLKFKNICTIFTAFNLC